MAIDQVIKHITEHIGQYRYGQESILNNEMKISYSPSLKKIKFDPFYNSDPYPTIGTCHELMRTAYREINDTYPSLQVIRATGTEPNYFKDREDNHCFLLLCKGDLMSGLCYSNNPQMLQDIISNNPLIVDPSFKIITPYLQSGYTLKNVTTHDFPLRYTTTLTIEDDSGVPLGIDTQGNMIHLRIDCNESNPITIGIQKPKEEIIPFPIYSKKLDTALSEDLRVHKFVEILRTTKLIKKEFKTQYNTITI